MDPIWAEKSESRRGTCLFAGKITWLYFDMKIDKSITEIRSGVELQTIHLWLWKRKDLLIFLLPVICHHYISMNPLLSLFCEFCLFDSYLFFFVICHSTFNSESDRTLQIQYFRQNIKIINSVRRKWNFL